MAKRKGLSRGTALLICILLLIVVELVFGFADVWYFAILRFVVCGIFVFCIYKGLQQETIVNAYFLFSLTPLSILMYSGSLSTYYLRDLTASTWIFVIINIIAFLFAFGISFRRKEREEDLLPSELREFDPAPPVLDKKRMILHAVVLSFIGFLPNAFALILGRPMPLASVFGLFGYLGIPMAFRSGKLSIVALCVLIKATSFLEDFNKTRLLYLAVLILVCLEVYVLKTRKQRVRVVFIGIALTVIMILVAFPLKAYTRSGGGIIDFFKNYSSIASSAFTSYDSRIDFSGPSFLFMPYMYLSQGWNNLQHVLLTQDTRSYGLWTIKPLLGYLQVDGFFESFYVLHPFNETFNTFTYMGVLFKDFGYYGSVIGSALLGLYVKWVTRNLRENCSAFTAGASALVMTATLEMFFSNHFFGQSYPFTIVIIGYLYKKLFNLKGY